MSGLVKIGLDPHVAQSMRKLRDYEGIISRCRSRIERALALCDAEMKEASDMGLNPDSAAPVNREMTG